MLVGLAVALTPIATLLLAEADDETPNDVVVAPKEPAVVLYLLNVISLLSVVPIKLDEEDVPLLPVQPHPLLELPAEDQLKVPEPLVVNCCPFVPSVEGNV